MALTMGGIASAHQPLITPNYYAFQLPPLVAGTPLRGELDSGDGQNFKDGSRLDLYRIDATAGESYHVTISTPVFSPVLSVYDPGGLLVSYSDFADHYGPATTTFEAATDGRYLLVVSGWSDLDLGEYVLELTQPALEAAAGVRVSLPSEIASQITLDLAPFPGGYGGGAEYYTFTVAEETFLVATMRSDQVDAVLVLLDEFGTVLNSNDDDGRSTDSQLTAVLQPGRYTVVASTYFAGESGDYTLVLDAFYRR